MNPPTFRILQNSGAKFLGFMGILAMTANHLLAEEPAPASTRPTQPATPAPAQPVPPAPAQAAAQTPSASTAPDPATASPANWEKRHAGEVSMEAPFPIEDGPDVLASAPERIRNTVVSVKTFKAGSRKQGFEVSVTNIIYKPGVAVNIDEAIKSVTDKMSGLVANQNHKLNIASFKVSGLDGRHSEFHGMSVNGLPFYAALAVVQQGQKLWQVQAISLKEDVVPDLVRVMGSIAIEPAAP